MEVYFKPLLPSDIFSITEHAIAKLGMPECEQAAMAVVKYASNGREAVNMVQLAAGVAMTEGRNHIDGKDIEWVANSSQIAPRPQPKVPKEPRIGFVNGLAVYGPGIGLLLEIEVSSIAANRAGAGTINVTGAVDEEEMGGGSKTLRRKSMAKSSVENVLTVLRQQGLPCSDYDIHLNFPGGIPMDGPSAGIAIACAITSSLKQIPIHHELAMTGEMSIHGKVKPVGGVIAKVEAAMQAGARKVLIPKENWLDLFDSLGDIEVIPVETIQEVLGIALNDEQLEHPDQTWSPVPGKESTLTPAMQFLHANRNHEHSSM